MKRLKAPETETALRIYLEHPSEIGSAEIKELFGIKAESTVARIKNEIRNIQQERSVKVWNSANVNTDIAYEVWGIDVDKLIKHYQRIQKLGMQKASETPKLTVLR